MARAESTSPDSLVEAGAIANVLSTPPRAPPVDHARLVEPQRHLEPGLRHQFGDPVRRQDRDIARIGRAHVFECVGVEAGRSEEHTSELQSLMRISYAVFCLKKKKNTKQQNTHP